MEEGLGPCVVAAVMCVMCVCTIIQHKAMSYCKGSHFYDSLSNNITDCKMSSAVEGTNVFVWRDTDM